MNLTEINSDITIEINNKNIIAHIISCDCQMSGLTSLEIRKKHPGLKLACLKYSYNYIKPLGKTFRYEDEKGVVYNMFCKKWSWQKSRFFISNKKYLSNLKECLINLKFQMIDNDEKCLIIPREGWDKDNCNWFDVKRLLCEVFKDSDISIFVLQKK